VRLEKYDVFKCSHDCAITLVEDDRFSVSFTRGLYVVLIAIHGPPPHNLVELYGVSGLDPLIIRNISKRVSVETLKRSMDFGYMSYDEKDSLELKTNHKLEDL